MGALLDWYSGYIGDQVSNIKNGNIIGMFPTAFNAVKNLPNAINEFQNPSKSRNYSDYNGDWLQYLKDMAADGDEASLDRLMNYMMQEQSNQTARDWTAQREDSQIQRFVADAKAAGFNPQALLQQGGSPIASASSGSSYSGNPYLSSDRYSKQNSVAWASLIANFSASVFKAVISGASNIVGSLASVAGAVVKAAG